MKLMQVRAGGVVRALLVGERPPPGARIETHSPLFFLPAGCSGARLREAGDLTIREYLGCFDRLNLVPWPGGTWAPEPARWHAASIVRGGLLRGRRVVLLGARVRDAFDGVLNSSVSPRHAEHARWYHDGYNSCYWGLLPHPSGRSRAWNDSKLQKRVGAFLREAAAGVD